MHSSGARSLASVSVVWFLALTVVTAALVVVLTRGSWNRLFHLPIQGSLFFVAGLFLQVALDVVEFAPRRGETAGYGLLMLSYAFLLAFCLVNLPLRGMAVIALGIALNAIVIGLNQGMPTRSVSANDHGRPVPVSVEQTVKHRPASSDDLLGFLGDEILLPKPFDTLVSVGDVVLLVGICELAYFSSRQRRRRSRHAVRSTPRRTSTRSSASSTRPSYT